MLLGIKRLILQEPMEHTLRLMQDTPPVIKKDGAIIDWKELLKDFSRKKSNL